jgi:subtilisin family serine protease
MAASDQSNPISDLHTAVTANLLSTVSGAEATRLAVGAKHAGNAQVAMVAAQVTAASDGAAAVIAANQSGRNLWIDHSVEQKQSRKRSREEALGRSKDCPSLQRVCWKWTGETTAAEACWLDSKSGSNATTIASGELEKTEFKCAVVMQGENVLQGLQALVDAGLAEAPLPDFVRNAPSMGGTIRVEHGAFVSGDTPFEAV